ncbi:MAG TPA: hypothetical protein VKY85_03825 [Candidatus Angelobacter sp.]|nr:hypothetical protein [Candidatus Angelobacter sp.]
MDFESKLRKSQPRNQHDPYAELCALFTSGNLTDDEQERLNAHLVECQACTQLLQTYRVVVRSGVPLLAAACQPEPEATLEPLAIESAKARLRKRIEEEKAKRGPQLVPPRSVGVFLPKLPALLAMAAALVLMAALVGFAYHLGQTTSRQMAQIQQMPQPAAGESLQPGKVQASTDQRSSLEERLITESRELQRLEQELKRQAAMISESKLSQEKLQHDSQQQISRIAGLDSDKAVLAAERDAMNRKLQETQNALNATQQRLEGLQEEHNRQLLRAASLQLRVDELSANLKQTQEVAQRDEGFLASDRDIRELMGARDLYIADVFDIDREGKTQRPFGRVFYTGGKSLLFYAFDLDRQPGVREASTFQVWGRRGPGDKRPLNMGILYQDSSANRRWTLRFDDPKVLAEIDAVFVTVEPRGKAGQKPTGRQLLFASLRTPPNHP